jgi:hypothetical protein
MERAMGIELYPQFTSLVFWRRCRPLQFPLEPSGVKLVLVTSNSVPASRCLNWSAKTAATSTHSAALEPAAYGLKFAGSFSGGTLLKTEFSTKLQAAGVNATAYAAKLPGGQTSLIILNKDAVADLEVELDFGGGMSGAVETETLHAPALDSREAHITTSKKTDSLKQGKSSVIVPRATGLRLAVI